MWTVWCSVPNASASGVITNSMRNTETAYMWNSTLIAIASRRRCLIGFESIPCDSDVRSMRMTRMPTNVTNNLWKLSVCAITFTNMLLWYLEHHSPKFTELSQTRQTQIIKRALDFTFHLECAASAVHTSWNWNLLLVCCFPVLCALPVWLRVAGISLVAIGPSRSFPLALGFRTRRIFMSHVTAIEEPISIIPWWQIVGMIYSAYSIFAVVILTSWVRRCALSTHFVQALPIGFWSKCMFRQDSLTRAVALPCVIVLWRAGLEHSVCPLLRHTLLQEPPRCLASPRGASQYAGVPNPTRVLNFFSCVFVSKSSYGEFAHSILILQLHTE